MSLFETHLVLPLRLQPLSERPTSSLFDQCFHDLILRGGLLSSRSSSVSLRSASHYPRHELFS
jgi:hypothetical protein